MKKVIFLILTLNLISLFTFTSCNKKDQIALNSADIIDIAPDLQWALVVVPYAAFRADCSFSSEVLGNARKGEIFMLTGKRTVLENDLEDSGEKRKIVWYHFDKGWLDESLVKIFDTKLKAESALRGI